MKCSVCGIRFGDKRSVRNHYQREHSGEIPEEAKNETPETRKARLYEFERKEDDAVVEYDGES